MVRSAVRCSFKPTHVQEGKGGRGASGPGISLHLNATATMDAGLAASAGADGAVAAASSDAVPTDGNRGGRGAGSCDVNLGNMCIGYMTCNTSPPDEPDISGAHIYWGSPMLRGDNHCEQSDKCSSIAAVRQSNVLALPVSLLNEVFAFLHPEDLCAMLGICRFFFCAAVRSDFSAWKPMCFSLWKNKQGLSRVVCGWFSVEEAHRREELELIRIQQRYAREYFGWGTINSMAQKSEVAMSATDVSLHMPEQLSHDVALEVRDSREAHQRQAWRWPLASTATYEAIVNATAASTPLSVPLPLLTCRDTPFESAGALSTLKGVQKREIGLHWWQMTHERRRQMLIRTRSGGARSCFRGKRLRYRNCTLPGPDNILQGVELVEASRQILCMTKCSDETCCPGIRLAEASASELCARGYIGDRCEAHEGSVDGFLRGMTIVRSVSALLHPHARGRTHLLATKPHRCRGGGDNNDDDLLKLPVSWKFSYYMSLHDSRRQKITMQELIEGTWFVCFRKTGNTHPACFNPDCSLLVYAALQTRDDNCQVHNLGGDPSTDVPVMPPVFYQLLRGGTELVFNSFPPLRVQRRSRPSLRSSASTGTPASASARNALLRHHVAGARGDASTEEAAAVCAFESEPNATLRRLMSFGRRTYQASDREHPSMLGEGVACDDDEDIDNDWGWVMQNFFVKIFSSATGIPLYVSRLEGLRGA